MRSRSRLLVVALLAALGMGVWWIATRSTSTREAPKFEAPTLVRGEPQSQVQLQVPESVQEETRLPGESVPEPSATEPAA